MKKIIWIILFILYLTVVTAAEPIYNYESLVLTETISNNIIIMPTRSDYSVQYFNLKLSLFPENSYRQEIIKSEFSPNNINQIFTWEYPRERTLHLDASFTLETSNKPVQITKKVSFPVKNIPYDISKYTKSTDNIDINEDIRSLAQNLAQNIDDLFILEYELANWMHENVQYNLSTLTANANYPSSWVLEKKYGVCDELTNLFISLNRALGIPARFVSGIAYSDSILFSEKWGNHGWAEVYFPEYGWIPYDITYNEFGELDATHISLEKEVDGTSPAIEYTTKGLYYNFEPSELKFDTNIKSYGKLKKPKTSISLHIKEKSVGFGTFNLFELTITNLKNYYVVEGITLAKASELEYFNPLQQDIVLKPLETKKVYWLVKVENDLDKNFIYTFPISVFANSGNQAETAFSVLAREKVYDQNYMSQFIETKETTTTSIDLNCSHNKEYILGDQIILTCTSNEKLKSICLENSCEYDSDSANFSFTASVVGISTTIITTKNDEGSRKHFFTYQINDQAKIYIPNISITQNVKFEEFATLKIKLVKNSSSNPRNVTMTLQHEMLQKEWFFSFLDTDKSFDIELPAQGFVAGENIFTITVTYLDSENNLQTIESKTTTQLSSLTNIQKVMIYYNTFASKLIKQLIKLGMSKYYSEIAVPGIIMLILFIFTTGIKNIFYNFRRRKIINLEKLEKK